LNKYYARSLLYRPTRQHSLTSTYLTQSNVGHIDYVWFTKVNSSPIERNAWRCLFCDLWVQ